MKSIKPGRGPSMMGAVGSAVAAVFGVFWTISAVSMGAPSFFAMFGIVFVLLGIGQAVYNYKNATGKNRFSVFDITEDGEEADPMSDLLHSTDSENDGSAVMSSAGTGNPSDLKNAAAFCPYCGAEAKTDFAYCAKCGKKLPQ